VVVRFPQGSVTNSSMPNLRSPDGRQSPPVGISRPSSAPSRSAQATEGARVAALYSAEVDRLVAFLCAGESTLSLQDAETIAQEGTLATRGRWSEIEQSSDPVLFLFTTAYQNLVRRERTGGWPEADPLAQAAGTQVPPADLERLRSLQDCLDELDPLTRRIVLLRELCSFSPEETAQILKTPQDTVRSSRGKALRHLMTLMNDALASGSARPGELAPGDFVALGRVLRRPDRQRTAQRQRFVESLVRAEHSERLRPTASGPAPAPPAGLSQPLQQSSLSQPLSQSSLSQPLRSSAGPSGTPGLGVPSTGSPVNRLSPTGLSAPGLTSDQVGGLAPSGYLNPNSFGSGLARENDPLTDGSYIDDGGSTPIFDAISAWFSTDSSAHATDDSQPAGERRRWESLDDGSWVAAAERAAESPRVEGQSGAGLPMRRPGANMVPSAREAASTSLWGASTPPRANADDVRRRLDSFQQGLNTARRDRDQTPDPHVESFLGPGQDGGGSPAPMRPTRDRSSDTGPVIRTDRSPRRSRSSESESRLRLGRGGSDDRRAPFSSGDRPSDFDAFYRDHMPHLLAALLFDGASPHEAAEYAQDAMAEALHLWRRIDDPQEWTLRQARDNRRKGPRDGNDGRGSFPPELPTFGP
jgi:DNA-directed RNA polymerase specialized sigma24 family protein